MGKKKRNPVQRLEAKIAARNRRDRIILAVAAAVIGVILLSLVVGIVIYNMIHDGGDEDNPYKAYLNKDGYVDLVEEDKVTLDQNSRAVGSCNGYTVTYEDLRYHVINEKRRLATIYGEEVWESTTTAEPLRGQLEEAVMAALQQDYLIFTACGKLSINTESDGIKNYVNDQVVGTWNEMAKLLQNNPELNKLYGSVEDAYLEYLDAQGMSESRFRTSQRLRYLPQLVLYALEENGALRYTLNNISEFLDFAESDDNYVRVVQVMVKDANKAQQIYEELRDITDPALREETMHAHIGATYNLDVENPTRNGYYFPRGEMVENYEAAAFALDLYGVSAPLEQDGYHYVLMRLPLDPDYVKKNAAEELASYQEMQTNQYIERFREDCAVTLNDYGKSLDFVTME